MNFASASCFAHMKIDYVLKMATVFQLVGCWIRPLSFLGPDYFWLLTLGTFVFFISNPLVLNAITTIANLWFSDDERAKATAIAGLMAARPKADAAIRPADLRIFRREYSDVIVSLCRFTV